LSANLCLVSASAKSFSFLYFIFFQLKFTSSSHFQNSLYALVVYKEFLKGPKRHLKQISSHSFSVFCNSVPLYDFKLTMRIIQKIEIKVLPIQSKCLRSDDDCITISSNSFATTSYQNKIISRSLQKFTCPMCYHTSEELREIEAHIGNEHLVN
jgi:hypothetical protein